MSGGWTSVPDGVPVPVCPRDPSGPPHSPHRLCPSGVTLDPSFLPFRPGRPNPDRSDLPGSRDPTVVSPRTLGCLPHHPHPRPSAEVHVRAGVRSASDRGPWPVGSFSVGRVQSLRVCTFAVLCLLTVVPILDETRGLAGPRVHSMSDSLPSHYTSKRYCIGEEDTRVGVSHPALLGLN